jgi:ubiquinone/menaquinone biosynthesis C-methylase UbiE
MNEEQRKAIIKETFDTVSPSYDSAPLRFFTASSDHLVSLLSLTGSESVIDIATGTGNAAVAVARRVPRGSVTGIDFSDGMLCQARRKAAAGGLGNITFVKQDMEALNFPEASFDAALCAFGIFFVDDMDAQLVRIARVVKPGGFIAICNFCEDYFTPLRGLMVQRLMAYGVQIPPQTWKQIASESGCMDLFTRAGLKDVRVAKKNMGYYLANEQEWRQIIMNAGFRRLISQLSPSDTDRFWKEHMQEISALKTKDGIWLDIGVLYTIGTK